MPLFDEEIKVKGVDEVERALAKLPADLQTALAKRKRQLAKNLAAKLRRAALRGSYKRQGTLVAPTVRQNGDGVSAGPQPILYASEFGANGRYGWYADQRFEHSIGRQFKPRNTSGYWWQPTIENSRPLYQQAVQQAVDEALNQWSA